MWCIKWMELYLLSTNLDNMYQAWQSKRHLTTRSWPNLAGIHFDFLANPKWQSTFCSLTCQSTWRVCSGEAFCWNCTCWPSSLPQNPMSELSAICCRPHCSAWRICLYWKLLWEALRTWQPTGMSWLNSNLLSAGQGLLANWRSLLCASQGLMANWWFLLSASQGLLAMKSCCAQAKACWQWKVCCAQAKACWQVGDTCWTQVKTRWQDWICWAQAKACWQFFDEVNFYHKRLNHTWQSTIMGR